MLQTDFIEEIFLFDEKLVSLLVNIDDWETLLVGPNLHHSFNIDISIFLRGTGESSYTHLSADLNQYIFRLAKKNIVKYRSPKYRMRGKASEHLGGGGGGNS